ncbi:MAG: PAS domain S-box protein, partial [Pseudomonadales bacterium]|nr:PAS domain S-box protein [Pseudomonadales bacterium]
MMQIELNVEEMGHSHLSSISERVWVADIESLKLDLMGMQRLDAAKYLSVTENGHVLAEIGTVPTDNIIRKVFPIRYDFQGETLEIAELTIVASSTDLIDELISRAIGAIVIIALQIFVIAGLILILFNRNITRHLRDIADFASRIELSNIDQTLVLNRRKSRNADELDVLLGALTNMQHQLNQSVMSLRESEENLSLTLDCIGDAVIATDFEGSVARMNPIAEQLTGWLLGDAVGKDIGEIFPIINADTSQIVDNPVKQAMKSGEIVTLSNSTTLLAKDGERYQIADSAAPIRDSSGEIIGGILVFHDVTSQYLMRQHLMEAEERLKLHIEQTPMGVIEWDEQFKVVEWNPAAEEIFGYSKKEAMGRSYMELIAPSSETEGIEERWDTFIDDLVADKFLLENITRQGKQVYCEWYSTPLLDESGKMLGVASLVLDVSQRMETEQALVQ